MSLHVEAIWILVSTVSASYVAASSLCTLKVVELAGVLVGLISAALKQWPLSNCSLLCQKIKQYSSHD